MATIDDLRAAIADHPEAEEAPGNTSFRVATFKVAGKAIVGVEKDRVHATFALTGPDIRRLADRADLEAETITRSGAPIGVRVDLAALTESRLRELLQLAVKRGAAARR